MTKTQNLTDAAAEFAAARLDALRSTDVALAALALAAPGSDAEFADAVSLAGASIGESAKEATFEPSDTFPSFAEFVRAAAKRSPYSVSKSTVQNLRNARRFLLAAGIPADDALALADAKRIVAKSAKSVETVAPLLRSETDPAAALAERAGKRAATDTGAAERAAVRAAETKAQRDADPVGFALAALLRDADGDAAKSDALAAMLDAAARTARAQARAAAGGAAAVDALAEPVAA